MDEKQRADTTSLPIDDRPEVHRTRAGSGGSAPIALDQDKELREGSYPRSDDERMRDLPADPKEAAKLSQPAGRKRQEKGNRGPDEVPGFGEGA